MKNTESPAERTKRSPRAPQKSSIPIEILKMICNPEKVDNKQYEDYIVHISQGFSRSSFTGCDYRAVESAALRHPEKYAADKIIRAFRHGQLQLEKMAHQAMTRGIKTFHFGYYMQLMKNRYGFGSRGHTDAPFSDLPEELWKSDVSAEKAPAETAAPVIRAEPVQSPAAATPMPDCESHPVESTDHESQPSVLPIHDAAPAPAPQILTSHHIPRHIRRQMLRASMKQQQRLGNQSCVE